MVQPDDARRHPPLDDSTDGRASAPAIGVATTLPVARIVYSGDEASAHSGQSTTVSARQGVPPLACEDTRCLTADNLSYVRF